MALTCGVGRLGAQRAHQFELGALGSFTRYDRAFGLEDRVGGGARLGYFFTDVVGAELDVGYQDLSPRTGSARSEEHTSELQSRSDLVCRLLLEKKKNLHSIENTVLKTFTVLGVRTSSLS